MNQYLAGHIKDLTRLKKRVRDSHFLLIRITAAPIFHLYPLAACCQLKGRSKRKLLRLLLFLGERGMRVYVYVDGFNFYYRALKNYPQYKWVDLAALSSRLLNPGDTVEAIRYFTARVSSRAGDPDAPRRQQILFNALGTIPNLHFHYGRFLAKTKRRPLVAPPHTTVEVHDTEEKGTDVSLAAHLINDGWMGRYDAALLLSQDSDLIEPLKIVKNDIKKVMGLVWLDGGSPNRHMKNAASFVRHLSQADLAASQFPDPIVRPDGTKIERPKTWV